MAEIKFTQLPVGGSLSGTEIFAMVQGGSSFSTTADDIANFVADIGVIYGDGIDYNSVTNTVSADINATNLQFTATQINTIQDIDLTASPTFSTMTLDSITEGWLMPRMTTVAFDAIVAPGEGLQAWSTSSKRYRVYTGSDYKELSYLDDIPLDNTAFGEFYFQGNAIPTTILTPTVPVKVDAVYSPGDLLGFTNGSGLLTYTAIDTKEFALSLSLTTAVNLDSDDIAVVIFINGSPVSKTEQETFTGSTTPGFQSTSVNALVELSTGDVVEVYIKNNTSINDITVKDLNMSLSSVGGAIGNIADQVVTSWDGSISPVSVVAGSGISITSGVISAVGGPGGEDLQQAYNNGDGTITEILGKAVEFKSIDQSWPVTYFSRLEYEPAANATISLVAAIANTSTASAANYYSERVKAEDTTSTSLSSKVETYALSNMPGVIGSPRLYMEYVGTKDQLNLASRVTVGQAKSGVVAKIASVIQATNSYPVGGGLTPVWVTLDGASNVLPYSFPIGSVIEIDCVGFAEYSQPTTALVSPSVFNVSFGGLMNINSSNTNFTQTSSFFNSGFSFKLRFVRTGLTHIEVSGFGSVMNENRTVAGFYFPNVSTNSYDESVTYALGVNWNKGVVITDGFYNMICKGLTINQYT